MKYERKNITMKKEQIEWVKKNNINLSRFVQKKIDQEKKKMKEYRQKEGAYWINAYIAKTISGGDLETFKKLNAIFNKGNNYLDYQF